MAYLNQVNTISDKGSIVNPASEEAIILLRRMVKILENQASTDSAQRQRFTLDAITGGLTLGTVTTVTGVTTVTTLTGITNALPAGTNNIGSINLAGQDQKQFIDISRTNYNTGIRNRLTFS
jgi:hypothetical protein